MAPTPYYTGGSGKVNDFFDFLEGGFSYSNSGYLSYSGYSSYSSYRELRARALRKKAHAESALRQARFFRRGHQCRLSIVIENCPDSQRWTTAAALPRRNY